jgi:hypothetical protein
MARTISQSTREEMNAPQTAMSLIPLLIISSDELTTPLYFTQNNVDVVSSVYDGEHTYTAANFTVNMPSQKESTVQDTSITISGINRQVTQVIRSITTAPTVRMVLVREDTPDTLELGPFLFKLREISYNVNSISGQLLHEYILRNYLSKTKITNQNFPGLFA